VSVSGGGSSYKIFAYVSSDLSDAAVTSTSLVSMFSVVLKTSLEVKRGGGLEVVTIVHSP
jgi:hypothetical protein